MRRFKTKKNMNFLSVFLILDVLLAFTMLKTSSASYTSTVDGVAEMDVALYAFNYSGLKDLNNNSYEFDLGEIKPGEQKKYKFSVSNANEEGTISDTSLIYNLKIISTNNLDLRFELYKVTNRTVNLISESNTNIAPDAYGTYFKYYTFADVCMQYGSSTPLVDEYELYVTFPDTYKESKYQDMVESIKIQLVSKQLVAGESCG
jgi:hypothetical protein